MAAFKPSNKSVGAKVKAEILTIDTPELRNTPDSLTGVGHVVHHVAPHVPGEGGLRLGQGQAQVRPQTEAQHEEDH